jgi:hypothetical protein
MTTRQGFAPEQLPRSIWGVSVRDFLGPTAVSESFALTGREDELEVYFGAEPSQHPLWTDGQYSVHTVNDPDFNPEATVLLRHGERTVGFYAGGMCWIDPDHRGKGLSTPLIVGSNLVLGAVPYTEPMGFSAAGLAAHEAAHRWTVLQALEAGLPVPPAIASETKGRLYTRSPLGP